MTNVVSGKRESAPSRTEDRQVTALDDARELREASREAHEATKDLRAAMRDGKQLLQEIRSAAKMAVDEALKPEIERHVKELSDSVKKTTDLATQDVFKRYDTIVEMLMGEDRASRRQGKPSVPEMIDERMHPHRGDYNG
jgi:hypothetical protein